MAKADYYCEKCWRGHSLASKIGKKHIKHARDERIRTKWTKLAREKGWIK